MRAILAAIDFSRATDLVVTEAARLARGLGGKVVLLTVLVEPVYVKAYAPPQKSISKITVAHERAVRRRLAAIQLRLQSSSSARRPSYAADRPLPHPRGGGGTRRRVHRDGSRAHRIFDLILGSTTQAAETCAPSGRCRSARMRLPRRPKVRLVAAAERREAHHSTATTIDSPKST
jgi:hypothetical protein